MSITSRVDALERQIHPGVFVGVVYNDETLAAALEAKAAGRRVYCICDPNHRGALAAGGVDNLRCIGGVDLASI